MIDKQSSTPIKKLWRLAFYIGLGILSSLALSAALIPLFFNHSLASFFLALHTGDAEWLPNASRLLAATQQIFTFLIPGTAFYIMFRTSKSLSKYSQKLFFYALSLNLISIPLVELAFYVNQFIPNSWMMDDTGTNQLFIEQILEGNGFGVQLTNILILCILPAIGEELVFRFGLQKHILSKSSLGPIGAIILTSFVFSFIHFDAQGFLPRFILSLIIGASYHISRTLIVPVLFHLFNNYMAYLQMKFGTEESFLPEYFYTNSLATLLIVGASIALLMLVFKFMAKTTNNNLQAKSVEESHNS